MADAKISALTEATDLADTDLVPVVDVSVPETKKITKENLIATLITDNANEYQLNQNLDSSSLAISTGDVAISFEDNGNAKLTLDENAELEAPTDLIDGRAILLKVAQDATGGWSLAFDAAYNFAGYDSEVNDAASAVTWYYFWTDGVNVFGRKIWEDD